MGSIAEIEAANIAPPLLNRAAGTDPNNISVIATSTASARTNLADAAQLGTRVAKGHYVTLLADGTDIYIAFTNSDAGAIDETANTGVTACWKLESDQPQTFRVVGEYTWLVHKAASGTPKLRVYLSSYTDQTQLWK